ncbi:MAG TPA: FMN-binding protein [Streptosporangiaceae bacterium]
MRRTPIVLGGTLAGLIGVLAFHTTPARSSFATVPGAAPSSGPAAGASPAATAPGQASGGGTTAGASPKPTAASQPAAASRTTAGPSVNYNYGVLSVRVTVAGKKIVKVGIASLDDGGDPRSQSIDQQSIPILEQEVMQAQSANIQGVSGASYTSAGFVQSLQSALHSLGV